MASKSDLPRIDLSKPWRISHELAGHTDDVKALAAIRSKDPDLKERVEAFASASRDETARLWTRHKPDSRPGNRLPSQWLPGKTYRGRRYQNSVAAYDDEQDNSLGLLMVGGLDARISVYRLPDVGMNKKSADEPFQILQDHYDNVCHLSVCSSKTADESAARTLLVSASWDCTSRVWRLRSDAKHGSLWTSLHTLKGHSAAVWAAEAIDCSEGEERYLTASADHFVRLWKGEQICRIFAGHSDVARGIALLPPVKTQRESSLPRFFDFEQLFATVSNDATVRVWSLDERRWPSGNSGSGGEPLRILKHSDDLSDILYDVRLVGLTADGNDERLLATSGEGGKVDLWNVESGECVASIAQPVMSAWALLILPLSGDLVTADSDGKIRVYTQRAFNNSFMAQERRIEVRQRGGLVELDRAEIEEHERKCQAITDIRKRRNGTGVVADVVTMEGSSSENNLFDGERYDSLLRIDVNDDSEALVLPINRGDDARTKAKWFIAKHSLSSNYEEEIVSFIERFGPS